jgi:hypothetical protein
MRFLLYLFVFVVLAAVVVGYAAWCHVHAKSNESFDDGKDGAKPAAPPPPHLPKPPGEAGADDDSTYDSRLYVLQTFDSVLRRKPSDPELTKYSALGSNSAIMSAIVRDYGKKGEHKAVDKAGRDSDSDSDSDSDDGEKWRRPRGEVMPYAPSHMHRATEASPDLGWPASKDGNDDKNANKSTRYAVSKPYARDASGEHDTHDGEHAKGVHVTMNVSTTEKKGDSGGDGPKSNANTCATRRREPPPDGGGGGAEPRSQTRAHDGDSHRKKENADEDADVRVCIDRADLRARLQGIADQVEQFKRFLDAM